MFSSCCGKKKKGKILDVSAKGSVKSSWEQLKNDQTDYGRNSIEKDRDIAAYNFRTADIRHSTPVTSSAVCPELLCARSPVTPARLASSRIDLAERRREFFGDLYQNMKHRELHITADNGATATATLPTIVRARRFGAVKNMRPVSQPAPGAPPELSESPQPPPGPHLLRSPPQSRSASRLAVESRDASRGFASDDFLDELRAATAGLSERWAAAEEERLLREAAKPSPVEETIEEKDLVPEADFTVNYVSLENFNCPFISVIGDKGIEEFPVHSNNNNLETMSNPVIPTKPQTQQYSLQATPILEVQKQNAKNERHNRGNDILPKSKEYVIPAESIKFIKKNFLSPTRCDDDILNELSEIEASALFKRGSVDIYDDKMPAIVIEPSSDSEMEDDFLTSEDFEMDLRSLYPRYTYTVEISPPGDDQEEVSEPMDLLEMIERMSSGEDNASLTSDSSSSLCSVGSAH